ncbi:IMPG2 protein, partial [Rhinopomastus cyanomelas]|nr:IMPG2 protein [Rhinopomastus cyanomelas]
LPGRGGAHGSDPRPWHRMAVARQGPHSALHPSLPSLRAGSREDSVASTGQPEAGTGPTSLQGAGSGLPVHTGTAGTPGVTSPGPEGGLDLTTGVLGPPDAEGPTEHSHISLDTTWHPSALPGQVTALVAPGSTAVAQSQVPQASPGSPRVPPSQQAAPASGSIAPTSPSPQPSTGASWGFPGFGPTVGTPWARTTLGQRLPQDDAWGDPAESPQSLEGITAGEGDAGSWAASPPPSWQPGSPAPPAAPGHPRQPPPSGPASSPGPTAALGSSGSAAPGPAPPADAGTVPSEPSAATEPQGDAGVLQRRPPTHGPTVVPGSPRQPTDPSGTVGRRGGPASPPPAGDTDPVQPSSSPGDTPRATPAAAGRAPRVFIVEDQPPLLRAPFLRIPCELVLAMGFVPALRDPASPERRRLLQNFNRTVAPLFMSAPGFLRLEVTGIRWGTVVLRYDALFAAERLQLPALRRTLDAALGAPRPGLAVGAAPVLRNAALEGPLDPCARLFSCPPGFACVAGPDGNASCTSLCHRGYCRNQGTCAHPPERGPLCQCPAGSDSWFVGLRCEQRLTRQGLLGTAAGVLLSIVLLGAVIAALAVRRFKVLLLEARADQTRSSYRRFCRLDDVSGQYWSRSWPPSASSLDNPAFSTSEELLHLHALDRGCCGCREGSASADGTKQQPPARPPGRPGCQRGWDTSSSSINDPMVDSGKASDISVSSWPAEPLQWTPFPLLQQLSRQRPHKARRPHSYCEGMELGTLERSWTA